MRWQYQAKAEAVNTSPETVTIDRWMGEAPTAPLVRVRRCPTSQHPDPAFLAPDAQAIFWTPCLPDHAVPPPRRPVSSTLIEPPLVIPDAQAIYWLPYLPDHTRGPARMPLPPPLHEALPAPDGRDVRPSVCAPDRLNPPVRRPLPVVAIESLPAPDGKDVHPASYHADRAGPAIRAPLPPALTEPLPAPDAQALFWLPIVPFAALARPRTTIAPALLEPLDPGAAPAPALSWQGSHPDRLGAAPRRPLPPALTEPLAAPDAGSVLRTDWLAIYPARLNLQPRRPLPPAVIEPLDAPDAVLFMAWRPVLPAGPLVRPRPALIPALLEPLPAEARPPAPDLSWAGCWPDTTVPAPRRAAGETSYAPDASDALRALPWLPVLPVRLPALPRAPILPAEPDHFPVYEPHRLLWLPELPAQARPPRLLCRPEWIELLPGGPLPSVRRIALPARVAVSFSLPATAADVALSLPATITTTKALIASDEMSAHSVIEAFRGEDLELNFTLDPVVNITGVTITFALSAELGGAALISKTATITSGLLGQFRVTLNSADTASLKARQYVWDCRRQPAGQKATIADGTLNLKREVAT